MTIRPWTMALLVVVSVISCKTASSSRVKDDENPNSTDTPDPSVDEGEAAGNLVAQRTTFVNAVNQVFGAERGNQNADKAQAGKWSFVDQDVGMQAIHMVVLPAKPDANGHPQSAKVLIANGSSNRIGARPNNAADTDNTGLYDPDTNHLSKAASPGPNAAGFGGADGFDLFCGNHIQTHNGDALFVGGTISYDPFRGFRTIWKYDWKTDNWSIFGRSSEGRWYPSVIPLGDGRIVVFNGLNEDSRVSHIFDAIDPDTGRVERYPTQNDGTAWNVVNNAVARMGRPGKDWDIYMRYVPHKDGRYLLTGDGTGYGDRQNTNTVYVRFSPPGGNFFVSTQNGPNRGNAGPGRFYPTVLFDPRPTHEQEYLIMGGMVGDQQGLDGLRDQNGERATTSLVRYNPRDGGSFNLDEENFMGGFMTRDGNQDRRINHEAVLLPTGDFVIVGGGRHGYTEPVFHTDMFVDEADLIGAREQCDYGRGPVDGPRGGFCRKVLAAHQLPRLYHTNAVLLPNGRVLLAGGNSNRGAYVAVPPPRHVTLLHFRQNLNGVANDPQRGDGSAANQNEDQFLEVFDPPYMFQGDRPEITDVSVPEVNYGQKFDFGIKNGADSKDKAMVTFVKLGSMTHSMDNGQRFVRLDFDQTGDRVTATAPEGDTRDLYPPGYYMLFYVRKGDTGKIPSVAKLVRLLPGNAQGG